MKLSDLHARSKSQKVFRVRMKSNLTPKEDFILEEEGDIKQFLKPHQHLKERLKLKDPETLARDCYVGPAHVIKKVIQERFSADPRNRQAVSAQHQIIKNYYHKMRTIREGRDSERKLNSQRHSAMRISDKIQENKQQMSLKHYQKMSNYWDDLGKKLAFKVKSNNLAFNRGASYRKKLEQFNVANYNSEMNWKISLRNNNNPLFVQISSTGIYAAVKNQQPECEIIRSPHRVPRERYHSHRPSQDIASLALFGTAKLKMEMDAAKKVGIENVRLDLLDLSTHKPTETDDILNESEVTYQS